MSDWISETKAKIAEREKIKAAKMNVMSSRKLINEVRKIVCATAGHGYGAIVWRIYDDGHIDVCEQRDIPIDSTMARMLDPKSPKWSEQPVGCHGWFMCDPRPDLKTMIKQTS